MTINQIAVQKNLIIARIISAVELKHGEMNKNGNRRYHSQRNARKAVESTPINEIEYMVQLDVYNWESALQGNSGFGEWVSRAAKYGENGYLNI